MDTIERRFVAGDLREARTEALLAYNSSATQDPWHVIFRVQLARICLYQGLGSEALSLLESPLPEGTPAKTAVRRNALLAIALARSKRPQASAGALADARRLAGTNITLKAEVDGAAGSVELNAGRLDSAGDLFARALAGARTSGDYFLEMQSSMNLGVVALHREQYEDALAVFGEAAHAAGALGARLAQEKAVGNAADAYLGLGDFQRALDSFNLAERQSEQLDVPIDRIRWLQQIGLCHLRLGEPSASLSAYEDALHQAEAIGNSELVFQSHVHLAYVLRRQDEVAALQHSDIAARIATERNDVPEQMEADLLRATLRAEVSATASIATLRRIDSARESTPSNRWQAEQEIAQIYATRGDHGLADLWFARALDSLYRQRASLRDIESTLPFLENGRDVYDAFVEHLVGEGRTDEALQILDRSRAQTLAARLEGDAEPHLQHPSVLMNSRAHELNVRALAGRLHATLLVYDLGSRASYLWAITRTRSGFYRLPGSASIAALVEAQNREILASHDFLSGSKGASAGHALFSALVEPAQDLLPPSGRVFIVADKQLHTLNFETLLTPGENTRFWIEDVTVTNAASLRLIESTPRLENRQNPVGRRDPPAAHRLPHERLLLVGDPVYPDRVGPTLPKASEEIQLVLTHFGPGLRTVLTGAEASPQAYKQSRPQDFTYIHFVAHATANRLQPLDSAVLLSAAPGTPEIRKLYARDILAEHLQARLVTISACYSSGRTNYVGVGIVGLAWAFLRAGSQNVIGAMWEVDDSSTPELMDGLYAALAQGTEPDQALRAAKLSLLHGGGFFRKPFYWAPFQLYAGARAPL